MTEFRFPPVLSTAAWVTEIDAPQGAAAGEGGGLGGFARGGPHLDFGRVEHVEFGVLARALLLLDAAVAAGVGATVTLPAHEVGQSEQGGRDLPEREARSGGAISDSWSRTRRTRHRAGRRGQARAFMRQAGFREAPHWPVDAVRVRGAGAAGQGEEIDELPSGDMPAGRSEQAVEPVGHRRRLLPLQWLQPVEGAGLRGAARYLAVEQGLSDLGLSAADARAISETVLAELIDNAARLAASHSSGTPRVLVGGQLFDRGHPPGPEDPFARPDFAGSAFGEAAFAAFPADPELGASRVLHLVAGGGGAPETLFEATVPIGPRFAAPTGHWSGHPALHRPHRLSWLGCTLDPRQGLTDADRSAYTAAISRTRGGLGISGTRTSGVVVTVSLGGEIDAGPGSTGNVRESVRQALDFLAQGAERAAVAAVFPDLTWQVLESCVPGGEAHGTGTAGPERTGPEKSGPEKGGGEKGGKNGRHAAGAMLVVGAQGRPLWHGGSAPTRAVLELLTSVGGVSLVGEARERWLGAGGSGDEFERFLRNQKHLVTVEGESLILLLSPLHVLSTLTDASQRELSAEAARHGKGVRRGMFRTPTLAVTNRWLDVGRLLDGTIGFDVAAFTLARAVQAELAALPPSRGPVVVAQTHTCPPRLATRLSECLALGDRTYPAGSELDRGGWPTAGDVPGEARVVLCADLILTENTVRRAVAEIVEHAEPVVIACAVDARVKRGRIKVLNREIPVVALAEVDLEAGQAEQSERVGRMHRLQALVPGAGAPPAIVDIDPVSLRPAPARAPERLPMSEEELLYWCAPQPESPAGALRIGHIEYARRMHASASIDLERMFRRDDARTRMTDVLVDAIQRGLARVHHRADPGRPEDAIQIWYPGEKRSKAGLLAHAAWTRLSENGQSVSAPVGIQHLSHGAVWPNSSGQEQPPRPRTLLIVDYSARTGRTLQALIRHAVRAGAERIVAVVLLDLLPEHDSGLLASLSAVSAEPTGTRATRGSDIPVAVRFISATSIGGLGAHECGLCATRDKYADVAEAPLRLRRHVDRLDELLRPRRRDELFESAPADLFGVPLLGDDAIDYLRWRGQLRRALHDTGARQEVLDRIAVLNQSSPDSVWGRRGLTRLLAAERGWLKLPPLRYGAAREQLARCCLDELDNPAPEPPWLRAQAVMVLAAAAPDRFAAVLPDLIELGADEPVVVDQVCLEAYRLARRPRHDSPVDLGALRNSLIRCREYLEGSRVDLDRQLAEDYVHVIRQLILLTELKPRPRLDDPREAWARLAADWCEAALRHRFESRLLRVRDFVEDLQVAEPSRERTAAAEADLRECTRLVEERVLAFLPRLREILAGDYAAELLGRRDQERFVELSGASAAGLLGLSERLSSLVREPRRPDDGRWRAQRRDLLDRIGWWYNALFATHRPGTDSPAQLVHLVRSVPALVGDVVHAAVEERGLSGTTKLSGDLAVPVFCPRDLLAEVVGHALDNARCRFAADEDADDDEPLFEVSIRRPAPDGVQLVICNSGALPGPEPGRGLAALARALRPFGGWLTGRALGSDGWTYEAVIALRPWSGAPLDRDSGEHSAFESRAAEHSAFEHRAIELRREDGSSEQNGVEDHGSGDDGTDDHDAVRYGDLEHSAAARSGAAEYSRLERGA
ncbi:phosphoribosyltransferase [Actinocrinis sp.]|uniref:phosphoribosyltransferase n=1 Tax=Actinocrinis sp. TaxID=1920516 RepID=UPI002D67AA66|nr:phosphoribosyltransferase [Actinocrinis sp.]HZP50994.1 phosphoribosyltransferase [Actinocrinis sp.]